MLHLPKKWSAFPPGNIVVELFGQITHAQLRRDFAVQMIGGVLHLHREARAYRRALLLERTNNENGWRFQELVYLFFAEIDDTVLDEALEYNANSTAYTVTIVVPPDCSMVLDSACRYGLLTAGRVPSTGDPTGNRPERRRKESRSSRRYRTRNDYVISIYPLNTFIAMRTCNLEIDSRWTQHRTILELFRRYNRLIIESRCDESILIDTSSECPA